MQNRFDKIFHGTIAVSVLLILLALLLDEPGDILPGLYRIISMQDLLITDYVYIAGVGGGAGELGAGDHRLHRDRQALQGSHERLHPGGDRTDDGLFHVRQERV